MKMVLRVVVSLVIATASLGLGADPISAEGPTTWQGSATGLSVEQNDEKKTAGLGIIVQAQGWPSLSLRGGVQDAGYHMAVVGPVGIDLGSITLPNTGAATLDSEVVDWAHNELTFAAGSDSHLDLWVSRLSPAILVQSSSDTLRLLAGDVKGSTVDGSRVQPRPDGPSYPKYVAYVSGGSLQIRTLGTAEIPLSSLDQNWLLVWYGDNSHFVDTKKPVTYSPPASNRWARASLPQEEAYQADAPLLLIFGNQPTGVKHSPEGGIELSFSSQAAYLSLLPLLGRDHPNVTETEGWSQSLPDDISSRVQWWANHLCSYPVTVSETYAYDARSDTATITENMTFLNTCSGGTTFAPLPPILAIVQDDLDVAFSGAIVDGRLYTEFGPTLGIENTPVYSWSISGLEKYVDAERVITGMGQPPAELERELVAQVEGIVDSGHLAPWRFMDKPVRDGCQGDIYWLNPADVLHHLVEVAEVLPQESADRLVQYIRSERTTYPPEDIYNLPLEEGTQRGPFALDEWSAFHCWSAREGIFLEDVPLYSFFALSRYHDLTSEPVSSGTWQKAEQALDRDMSEQDWATFYWFRGFENRMVAVVNANRHFAGLVGHIRLAGRVGDVQAENLGRALLAKAAVLRLAMARYPRDLCAAGLVELPSDPDWQPRHTAGRWFGYLFVYGWTNPFDDPRQVVSLNQFEVYLHDQHGWDLHSHLNEFSSHLVAFRDMTPELARLLSDYAEEDVQIYVDKVEALSPHWYAAFAEGILGKEHNLSHPTDSFQIFLANALIQEENPDVLSGYLDIPWLQAGDLYYVHKLAETIRAYCGTAWDDSVLLRGVPRDRAIHLSWSVYTPLPPETTWQIDYQSQTGTLYIPIAGIISSTRAYTLTGLTNYIWYTVTLSAMLGDQPFLTSNQVVAMPTDIFVYLPLILKMASS